MGEVQRGTLYGVSLGPGNTDLLTIKAVRIMREADVVAIPDQGGRRGVAYGIACEYVRDKPVVWCPAPMTHDQDQFDAAHAESVRRICAHLGERRSVAYLCLGDVGVYSSFYYVEPGVRARGFATIAVPGVSSPCAVAAALGMPLCMGGERLTIAPATTRPFANLLDEPGTKVLMKPSADVCALREELAARGMLGNASAVSRCGMGDERVYRTFEDVNELGYLATVIVRDAR